MYEDCKIYGPYKRKDGRKHVVIIWPDKRRQTVSYPKFLMEKHLGRYLLKNETVDHRDKDFTNDEIGNLRVLDRKEHAKLDAKRLKAQNFICPICEKSFWLDGIQLSRVKRSCHAGPFCSRSCRGKYATDIQNGRRKKIDKNRECQYTTLKDLQQSVGIGNTNST